MSASQRQEFCVRWNSHLGSLGAAFPQLLAGQRFVDVTLACEGHQVHCHRLVLAACSSYFESILAENPCKHPVIILPSEIKLWEIQALVDFMYKGEVNVTQTGLPQLLRCAEQLRIRGLYGSDAALNLNQLKALGAKSSAALNASEAVEEEDTATNSTSTTTNTTATAASALQQLQMAATTHTSKEQQQQQQQAMKRASQMNGQQHQLHKLAAAAALDANAGNSNAATEEDSCEDDSATSNAYDDEQFELKPSIHNLESTIDEDHNYTAHEEEENYFSSEMMDTSGHNSSLNMSGLDSSSASFKRVRRSEASLAEAAKCVSKGQTFQNVSNAFNIPVSTIRFYMARKGILPKRRRGRGASNASASMSNLSGAGSNSPDMALAQTLAQMKRSSSPSSAAQLLEPPYHMLAGIGNLATYKQMNDSSAAM